MHAVRAISDYEATEEGELSVQRGDLIRITGIRHDGWWEGHNIDSNGSTSGLVPRVFVEMFPPPDPAQPPPVEPYPYPSEDHSFDLVTPTTLRHEGRQPWYTSEDDLGVRLAALNSGPSRAARRLSLTPSTPSSMYTDPRSPPGPSYPDPDFRLQSPDFLHARLSPMRLRRTSDPSELLHRSEDILYYGMTKLVISTGHSYLTRRA